MCGYVDLDQLGLRFSPFVKPPKEDACFTVLLAARKSGLVKHMGLVEHIEGKVRKGTGAQDPEEHDHGEPAQGPVPVRSLRKYSLGQFLQGE